MDGMNGGGGLGVDAFTFGAAFNDMSGFSGGGGSNNTSAPPPSKSSNTSLFSEIHNF
jgi:hypothetical protein